MAQDSARSVIRCLLIFDLLFQHLVLVRNVITQNAFYSQWKFKRNYQHDIESTSLGDEFSSRKGRKKKKIIKI